MIQDEKRKQERKKDEEIKMRFDGELRIDGEQLSKAMEVMDNLTAKFTSGEYQRLEQQVDRIQTFYVHLEIDEQLEEKDADDILKDVLVDISKEVVGGYLNVEYEDRYTGGFVGEVHFKKDHTLEIENSFSEHTLKESMEEAGYYFDEINSGDQNLRFNYDGGTVVYENWTKVKEWLEGVVFDDPEVSDAVESIMHPESNRETLNEKLLKAALKADKGDSEPDKAAAAERRDER